MASEANTERHIPGLFTPISNEIARMGLPVGLVFDVAGEEALTVTLDVDAGDGVPPEGFALVADGTVEGTTELLKRARFEPELIGVSEGATVLSEDAALIIVDPSPTESRGPEYDGVGAVVLSDARFAARELANRAVECGRELGFVLASDLPAQTGLSDAGSELADESVAQTVPTSDVEANAEASAEASADTGTEEAATHEAGIPGAGDFEDLDHEADTGEEEASLTEASDAYGPREQDGEGHLADASSQVEQEYAETADGAGGTTQHRDAQAHDLPESGYSPSSASGADSADSGADGAGPEDMVGEGDSPAANPSVADMPEDRTPRMADDSLDDTASGTAAYDALDQTDSEPAAEEETGGAAHTSQARQAPSELEQEPPQSTDPSPADMPAESTPQATGPAHRLDEGQPSAPTDDEAAIPGPQTQPEHAQQPPHKDSGEPEAAEPPEGDRHGDGNASTGIDGLYDAEVFGPLSDYVQRLHHIRDALEADAEDGRAMTPEQEKALQVLQSMSVGRNFYRRIRAAFKRPPDELDRIIADACEPIWSLITPAEAAGFIRSPYPGVIAIGNNKGGCGKSIVCEELAASIATTGVPDGHERGIKVLLVEQNYANPDLRKRVKLPPGRPPGMIEYIEQMRAAEAAGGELPDLSEYVSHVQGLQTDNLYLLPIAADEGEWRHSGKATADDLDAVYEAAADAGFDILVVDLQNGLPQAGNLTAETIGFWISVADVMYLVVNPSEAVQNGSEFLDGARALVEYYGNSCSLVPVFNEWRGQRNTSKRWARGLAALGADSAIAPAEFIPSEFAEQIEEDDTAYGQRPYFHRIPADPAVPDFMLEKRQISLESRRFKEPFYLLATDALTRIKQNNVRYFESAAGEGSSAAPESDDSAEEGSS